MSDHDRWRDDEDRFRGREEHDRDRSGYGPDYRRHRPGPEREHFGRHDRESFARGDDFGRESRDFPGGRGPVYDDGRRPGRREEGWDRAWDPDRSGQPSWERSSRSFGERDRGGEHGRRGSAQAGRSSTEMAFGRDDDRDYREGDFSRRYEPQDRGWFERATDEVASWFGGDGSDRHRGPGDRVQERFGEHRGRGPRSYQRSDQRIQDDVNDRLTDDPWLDASDIEVSVSGREVTLSGTVSRREDKRRAEDLAESVSGVTHVQNNLRVKAQSGTATWSDDRLAGGTDPTGIRSASASAAGGSTTSSSFASSGAGTGFTGDRES